MGASYRCHRCDFPLGPSRLLSLAQTFVFDLILSLLRIVDDFVKVIDVLQRVLATSLVNLRRIQRIFNLRPKFVEFCDRLVKVLEVQTSAAKEPLSN